MKKLIILLTVFFTLFCKAQDKRFTLSIYSEPQHYLSNNTDTLIHWEKADGFNIGMQIEYQMTLMYFDAEVYVFPNLNNLNYFHFEGTLIGFNYHSRNERFRYSLGLLKLGVVYRTGPHPMIGHDAGFEYYFNDNFYTGVSIGYDFKQDDKEWRSKGQGHGVWSSGLRFGIIL